MRLNRALALALAVSAAMAASALGGKVRVDDATGVLNGTDGSGGAFKVTTINPYNGEHGGPGGSLSSFSSFCIERSEHLSFGSQYFTNITSEARGGGGGAVNGVDPLDAQTAKLYSAFRAGANFGGTIGVIDLSKETTALQYAIWRIEQETDLSYTGLSNPNGEFALADEFIAYAVGASGNYGVRVLQLWTGFNAQTGVYSGNSQDLLTVVPTPQAALGGMSLLAGLGVLGYVKRRRNNADIV